jgi:hypothetical protein
LKTRTIIFLLAVTCPWCLFGKNNPLESRSEVIVSSNLKWTAKVEEKTLNISFMFSNPEDKKIYIFQPDPPYVSIQSDRTVRIWYGLYVLGPKDIVEAPVVPPVVEIEKGGTYKKEFQLNLPLDEIHPFPKYEHAEKVILKSNNIHLEIGYFPFDEKNLPPLMKQGDKMIQLAPYDWASKTLRYVQSNSLAVEVPIRMPRKLIKQ